ncbi:polyvinyl alcohol dehydrogenase (cytochrome) [Bradyrhizobium sp. USDA 4501]|uniref:PQQ-binding-like beta-propeller repeat protein n=1 Tax=Bradyrhizobium brasilense TaxID=1419277 RepID=A0ABY8J9M9_9BRAD|nr:PQQ-binding-like beta-propeller repeat protein [Bradyrhizobium brasilense]NLS73623.1 cytochrome C oxidase Cbb3 [Bradyrhizobium brasilense]OMI06895.1 cytochrome C oxidase Cbb3 [Bradyrhizobium brasilense]WFU62275.1 PQQ-binding-like beta-propeller repeat protein [Bradyrhizobium brasilense]
MKLSAAIAIALISSCLPAAAQQAGADLYAQRCAQCHDSSNAAVRAPSRTALQSRSFDEVLGAITTGPMASFAQGLASDERAAIASLVTGKAASLVPTESAGQCAQNETGFPQPIDGPRWNGWGTDINNSRFQPAAMAGLAQDQVPRLRLKWAFGFPDTSNANAQPAVVGGLLFVGGGDRKVHALDAKTGCTRWEFPTEAPVRTAISFAPLDNDQSAIFFGDVRANVYALNAATGKLIWKSKVDDHVAARITGAPVFYSGVVYVGVSSIEEAIGSRPTYQCCTFRGSVVALKAETGAQIWKAYTIPEAPHPTRANALGTQLFGPAGASVWSAPTIDVQRQALYVATSNSYADPATDTSDAILAFDLATGRMLWHQQATPKDSFVVACFGTDQSNCPEDRGPDHDFGQSPILVSLRNGQRVLVIGQKSGVVHALDPDHEGKILWQTRIGKGGALGGTEWGSAADQDRIYVANSDVRFLRDGTRRLNSSEGGGLFGLDLATGRIAMQVAPVACGDRPQCSPALSAAVTAIPGVVFSGGVSGFLRAYATDDARLLWEIDTARDYATVNGVAAHGGAMDGPGPVVVDGMLYVNSGYAQWSGLPGNVLLAFEVGNP